MIRCRIAFGMAVLLAMSSGHAAAQDIDNSLGSSGMQAEPDVVDVPVPPDGIAPGHSELPATPRVIVVPRLTPIVIRIDDTLGSKTSSDGDRFSITLADPLVHAGCVVLPAGTVGTGEVVHAKKAGGSGAPGELILAAEALGFDGRDIPLRSMRFTQTGEGQEGLAMAVGMTPLSPVGFLITGRNIEVPAGTTAEARLAQDTEFTIEEGEMQCGITTNE